MVSSDFFIIMQHFIKITYDTPRHINVVMNMIEESLSRSYEGAYVAETDIVCYGNGKVH